MSEDALTLAVDTADLPGLVARHYPDSLAHPGRGGACKAAWRGEENPSASLFRARSGCWLLRDHGTGEVFNAYQFLTVIVGLGIDEAKRELLMGENAPLRVKRPQGEKIKPLSQKEMEKYTAWRLVRDTHMPAALSGRGFLPSDMREFGVVDDNGDALFPIFDPYGDVVGVKRRHRARDAVPRYIYEFKDHGSPCWCSPGILDSRVVIVTEGELNAMVAYSVLREAGITHIGTIGVPGASVSQLPSEALEEKPVYIYADEDGVGLKAREVWAQQAAQIRHAGVYQLPYLGADFCDLAAKGRAELAALVSKSLGTSQTVASIDDRIIAGLYTIRELRDSVDRILKGEIVMPTGYTELDNYTMGLPEAGIVLVCALPSFGKSVFIRDVLMHHVMKLNHKVMLFSPDQSVKSVTRFMANKISGIPLWRIMRGAYTQELLDTYGDADAIKTVWKETYDYCLYELMEKYFTISEESEVATIKKEVERALDHGVSIFAADYFQMLEPDDQYGRSMDGKAPTQFKKDVHRWRVPFLFATQLAKSKFNPSLNRNGVPYAGDIEGHGTYYQSAELIFMLYSYELYWREYVNPNNPPDPPPQFEFDKNKHRVYVRKNKDMDWGQYRYLRWNKDLVTFENMTSGVDTDGRLA